MKPFCSLGRVTRPNPPAKSSRYSKRGSTTNMPARSMSPHDFFARSRTRASHSVPSASGATSMHPLEDVGRNVSTLRRSPDVVVVEAAHGELLAEHARVAVHHERARRDV